MHKYLVLIFCVFAFFTGCAIDRGDSGEPSAKNEAKYTAITEEFGQALISDNTGSAYSMTSKIYQSNTSEEQFKSQYEEYVREFGQPVELQIDFGTIPTSREEATDDYDISPDIPLESMKAWTFAILNADKGQFEARLLIIDQEGALKIGHIEFGLD